MAQGYPDNKDCWACNGNLKPVDGAIVVFAYAAMNKKTPCDEKTIAPFNAFLGNVYAAAPKVGIDPVYLFGYIQYTGRWPDIPTLDNYLDAIGVRDPATQQLHNATPGGTMYRPGPGDGYVGNTPGSSDPGLGHNPYWTPPAGLPAPPAGGPPASSDGGGGGTTPTTLSGLIAQAEAHPLAVGVGAGVLLLLLRGR